MTTRYVANLDCETAWARLDAAVRARDELPAPSTRDPRFALPPRVLAGVSALGTLCRAFLQDGDRLWTPAPVDPARMAAAPGLPTPKLESDPLDALTPADRTLHWGPPGEDGRAANDRGVHHERAARLRLTLPGSCVVRDEAQWLAGIASPALRAAGEGRWVLKAPFSAAGRSRVRGADATPDDATRKRALTLLGLYGRGILEPWVDRVADIGVVIGSRGMRTHGLDVDAAGRFRGIDLARGPDDRELAELRSVVDALAPGSGPAGIDAYRWREPGGSARFQAFGELNARTTFGAVARALAGRLTPPAGLPCDALRLRIGREPELARAGPRTVPLLLPGAPDGHAAWVQWGDLSGSAPGTD